MLRSLLSALPLLLAAATAAAVETPPVRPSDWGPDTPLMQAVPPRQLGADVSARQSGQVRDHFFSDATRIPPDASRVEHHASVETSSDRSGCNGRCMTLNGDASWLRRRICAARRCRRSGFGLEGA